MRRSVGVTVVAILSLIGSVLTLGLGIMMLFLPAHPGEAPMSPVSFKFLMIMASLIYTVPAVWGIITSIGLFRLKNWARISTIVFSILLILMGGLSAMTMLLIPMPSVPGGAEIRAGMAAFWLALLAIGVWWLVFFTRAAVKAQFVPGAAAQPQTAEPRPPGRPVSITVIAVFGLTGCVFLPLAFLFHAPAILFTWLLTGWPAIVYYIGFAAVQAFIGIGLLRLKPAARLAAIAFYVFCALNSAIFFLAPGAHARMQALMNSYPVFPGTEELRRQYATQFDVAPIQTAGAVVGLAMVGLTLYFLITRKPAFYPNAGERLG